MFYSKSENVMQAEKSIAQRASYILIFLFFITSSTLYAVGDMPVPNLDNPSIGVTTTYDVNTRRYTYNYNITNPSTSSGNIWRFKIDITQRNGYLWNFTNLSIPFGTKNITFNEWYNKIQPFYLPKGFGITPIGQTVPTGWAGGFGRDGMAGFASRTGTLMIQPGQTLSGFSITGPGLPIIRKTEIIPHWVLLIDDHDQLTNEIELAANTVNKNIRREVYTLGPAGIIESGSFNHWNILRSNVTKAVELKWVTDQNLTTEITSLLKTAREAVNNQEGKLAKLHLQNTITLLNNSNSQQRSQAFYDLIYFHVNDLIAYTQDIPPRFVPKITLTPEVKELPIGTLHTFTAKVVNIADEVAPVEGYYLSFRVRSGPHVGKGLDADTDANGEAKFEYIGTKVGKDHVKVFEGGD